jgi:DnaJ-class molecular chaperone
VRIEIKAPAPAGTKEVQCKFCDLHFWTPKDDIEPYACSTCTGQGTGGRVEKAERGHGMDA